MFSLKGIVRHTPWLSFVVRIYIAFQGPVRAMIYLLFESAKLQGLFWVLKVIRDIKTSDSMES